MRASPGMLGAARRARDEDGSLRDVINAALDAATREIRQEVTLELSTQAFLRKLEETMASGADAVEVVNLIQDHLRKRGKR